MISSLDSPQILSYFLKVQEDDTQTSGGQPTMGDGPGEYVITPLGSQVELKVMTQQSSQLNIIIHTRCNQCTHDILLTSVILNRWRCSAKRYKILH